MKKNYSPVLLIFLCLYGTFARLSAQSLSPTVVNVSGGTYKFGYSTIDWSIGEMPLVNTLSNTIVVVTNGLLQPFTDKPAGTDNGGTFTPDEIRVFPNPVSIYLEINFLTQQKGMMGFRLYNGIGQLIFQKEFPHYGLGRIERIDMQHLPAAEYFLQVVLEPEPGSVAKKGGYKIIKLR